MTTKQTIMIFGIIVLFFLSNLLYASENLLLSKHGQLELLSKAKVSDISKREIAEAATEDSKKHSDDGYLANPKATDCFDALGYRYTGGRYNNELIRFRLRCPPKIKPNKKYPLIVWFHGKGESGNDNERQLAHLQYTLPFLVGPESLDFFMLVTQCPQDNPYWDTSVSQEGKGDAPFTIAMEIFERILEEYPIDKTKISTFGQCSGAVGSTELIRKYPQLISAVVYISATHPVGLMMKDVTISSFNCTDDPNVSIQGMRDYVKRVNDAGGNAHLTEIKAASHDAWTPALSQYKVIAWMIVQKKNSFLSPPPGVVLNTLSWTQVFIYFGLPICCLIPLLVIRFWKRK
jgi:predicted peptidase